MKTKQQINTVNECKTIRRRGYVRVSTRDQVSGFGLDVQKEKIKDYMCLYATKQQAKDLKIHVDGGLSGKNMNRAALNELLEDVKHDLVDEIIIYKLDRIARNVNDVYFIISLLIEHHCNLISVMDHLDIYTANGRLLIGILAAMAQWERETTLERTIDSTIEQLEEGLYPFGMPMFGYKKEGKSLLPNEQESAAYRFIVQKASEGMILVDLSKELELEYGIKKRDTQIKDILERDYYATGLYPYKGKKYSIVPPLVTWEELRTARKILKKRAIITKNDRYVYRNKIRTVEGDICVCKPTKKKHYHVYYYEFERKRINQKHIDQQVLVQLMMYANELNNDEHNVRLRRQILKLQKRLNDTCENYASGRIDPKAYGFAVQKLTTALEKKKKEVQMVAEDDMTIEKWQELSDTERAIYIDQYIAAIIVDLDLKLVVSIKFKK